MHKKTKNRLAKATLGTSYDRDIDLSTLASLLTTDRPHANAQPAERRDGKVPSGGKHVIAYFAACPSGSNPLKLGDECAAIQREIKATPHRDDFRFESRWAVTIDELICHINELDPTVIHFSGHGGKEGLVLQDEQGWPESVSPRALARLIDATVRSTRIVLLNACSTIEHAEMLCTTLDCTIAMAGPINDDAARMFATRFYGALGNRRSIGNAFRQGVAKLAIKGLPDELVPLCKTRADVDANQLILLPAKAGRATR